MLSWGWVAKCINHFFPDVFLVKYEFQVFEPLVFMYKSDLMVTMCLCHWVWLPTSVPQLCPCGKTLLNPIFPPPPPQPTHEQVHLSSLWLFTERPVQECPTLHFCLVLCLGISTGPFADSGIPFLANLAFAVWSLMYLEVKLSRGQRKGLSSACPSRSSPQEWLMPGLREMAPCLGYRWAVYLASLICSYLTDKVEL